VFISQTPVWHLSTPHGACSQAKMSKNTGLNFHVATGIEEVFSSLLQWNG